MPPATRSRKVGQNPNRANDVDTDHRRRTLNSAGAMPLTEPFIEGSNERAFVVIGQDDLRAFQTSSQGHCRAQSKVAIGCLVVEPGGGWISMRSAISSPH